MDVQNSSSTSSKTYPADPGFGEEAFEGIYLVGQMTSILRVYDFSLVLKCAQQSLLGRDGHRVFGRHGYDPL